MKSVKKSNRRIAREYALRVLYAYELTESPVSMILEDRLMGQLKYETARRFARRLIGLCAEHAKEFDEIIQRKTFNWEFHRIALIDRLILRMGICEFLYFEDIPPKVTINEAIEIAKKYSTEKSGVFVNGMLDSIYQELKAAGKIVKSGRGLLET